MKYGQKWTASKEAALVMIPQRKKDEGQYGGRTQNLNGVAKKCPQDRVGLLAGDREGHKEGNHAAKRSEVDCG